MKYTLKEICKSMPREKAKRDSIWTKIFARPISYPLAWVFLNMGLTPNSVSVIAIMDALVGCILLSIPFFACNIVGLILLVLFIVFDCVDGTMARTLKRNSYMGEFYDAMGGYTICAFSLLAVSLCGFFNDKTLVSSDCLILLVIAGSVGSITNIFSRLIYQKYTANEMIANDKKGLPIKRENDSYYTEKPSFSITYIRLEIDRQFGIGGFFPPLIVIAFIFNFLDILVYVYGLYYLLAFVAVMFIFCRKASAYDKNVNNNGDKE